MSASSPPRRCAGTSGSNILAWPWPGSTRYAGEDGTIGREEIEILTPAARVPARPRRRLPEPSPSDSLFHAEARLRYDAVVCAYHDQALIPIKMLDFWGGVNLTLGLPIVRTSPDHGTGFDIAGRGIARADSLIAAVRMAGEIAASSRTVSIAA